MAVRNPAITRLALAGNINSPGPGMPEKIIIDPDCHRPDIVRHDILTRAHYHSHRLVSFDETKGSDGRIILTIDFRGSLDTDRFRSWLSTVDGIVRR